MTTTPAMFAALLAGATLVFTGCAVTDGQSTVGQYVDDATITTQVKARMADDPTISAMRISVETVNGTVQLSGFATSQSEKDRAGVVPRDITGVRDVRNSIVVRTGS